MSPSQREIAESFTTFPIMFIQGLGQIFDVPIGVLLSQLLYWDGKGWSKDGYFYKTANELYEETSLSDRQIKRAIDVLVAYRIIDYKISRILATRHFRIKHQNLRFVVTSFHNSGKLVTPEAVLKFERSGETITEITQRIALRNHQGEHTPHSSSAGGVNAAGSELSILDIADIFESNTPEGSDENVI